ncbi:GIY-YIG nuclease family protein, partial [Halomonas sp. SIMBA_159]
LELASGDEKADIQHKVLELEAKLALVEKDKEDVLNREQNTRAGYVYIISNIGSFGEDVYKIGMTRRLEPMDRVKELGDAS